MPTYASHVRRWVTDRYIVCECVVLESRPCYSTPSRIEKARAARPRRARTFVHQGPFNGEGDFRFYDYNIGGGD
eukprot:1183395-Prorocentrum_minimum.AAC.4